MKIKIYKNKNGTYFIKSRDYEKLNNLQDKNALVRYILEVYKNKKENI